MNLFGVLKESTKQIRLSKRFSFCETPFIGQPLLTGTEMCVYKHKHMSVLLQGMQKWRRTWKPHEATKHCSYEFRLTVYAVVRVTGLDLYSIAAPVLAPRLL